MFHLARVRKILAVPHLSLDSVSELANGKPHAGYVFPLLHAVEAAALRVAGINPTTGFPDLVPAAVILVVFTTFAAGRAVGGTAVGTSALALVLWTWMVSSHPNLGMASWPGPFTFLVLMPVGVLAITELLRTPGDRRLTALLAATALSVSLVHVSYGYRCWRCWWESSPTRADACCPWCWPVQSPPPSSASSGWRRCMGTRSR